MCYLISMVKSLEIAIARMASLPDSDQDQIARRLLSHVEKLQQLRAEVDKGVRSLDAGDGAPLDIEEFLQQKNKPYGVPSPAFAGPNSNGDPVLRKGNGGAKRTFCEGTGFPLSRE